MGGKFKSILPKQYEEDLQNHTGETYSVYIQFDGDEPKELFRQIPMIDKVVFTLDGPGPQSEFIFTDTVTGKQFRLFAK